MDRLAELLQNAEVLGKLRAPHKEDLAASAVRRELHGRESLYLQGDDWKNVLLIESGRLQSVIHSPSGTKSYVVSTWSPGEEFWPHPLFDSGTNPSSLEAVEDSVAYEWDGDRVFDFLLESPDAVRALFARLIGQIRKRRQKIFELAFHPVTGRLAGVLLQQVPETADSAPRDLTLDQLAARVATSPEVVCRVLYQLQRDGLLQLTRASITLSDRAGLEALVDKE
jgi:CRP-like cAMP-binding protein